MSGSFFMLQFLKKQTMEIRRASVILSTSTFSNPNNKYKCRICLEEGAISIFGQSSGHNNNIDLVEVIQMFGDIKVNESEDLPKHICITCYNFLQSAVLFRKKAKETDAFLRKPADEDINGDLDTPQTVDDPEDTNGPKSYNCKLCKLNFESFDAFVIHKNSKAHKKVRVQCPVCRRLLTAQLYKHHMVRHQSVSHLVCDVCGKLYRKDNLVRHLQLHSKDLPFQCQQCPYRGRFVESLKLHMKKHTGEKPFSCDKCELRFLTKSNLNRHLLTHNKEKPFKCAECSRGFYTKRDMEVHFKADHAGLKEYSCKMCGHKFGTRKALMRHELRVHKRVKMAKGRTPLYLQAEYQK